MRTVAVLGGATDRDLEEEGEGMREFLAILIPYLFGCVTSYLMFQPMKQFEDGYKRAKEHYSNWNRGFDEGFAAAKKHYQDWDEGFGEGFESGWDCALEQKGEQG